MKEEFSRRLKEKRRDLGLGIEEVVEKTKLHPSVIKALEEGKWEEINPTYLKGFLKIYCSFLGEAFLEADFFSLIKPKEESLSKKIQKIPTSKKIVTRNLSFMLGTRFLLIFLGVGLFVLAVFSLTKKIKSGNAKETSPIKAIPLESSVSSKEIPLTEKKNLYVTLTTKRDCFVMAKVEGKVLFEGILREGAVESWETDGEVEFRISDGSVVDIEVNGKLLPPLTKIHKPIKSLKITPSGISVVK